MLHTPFSFPLIAYAGSHPEGGGDGGEYGDQNVQDLAPDVLVFHEFLSYKFRVMNYEFFEL